MTTILTPTGKSVTDKFNSIDRADTKRIIDICKGGTRCIRTESAWYGVGLIMTSLRTDVEANGGKRITTKMLEDAGIDTISKERRRDGEQLVALEDELHEFMNMLNAPISITNVAGLLRAYNDFIKSAKTSDESDESESDDDAAPMTAAELAASTLKIAKAKNIDIIALMQELANQASGSGNGVDIVEFNATEIAA